MIYLKIIETDTPEYQEMLELRMQVLLRPIGIDVSYISSENEKRDDLLAVFENTRLVACCILTKLTNTTVQLRQMAVTSEKQRSGVGALLLRFAEATAREKGFALLVLHARDAVIPFYNRFGYAVTGDAFTEVGIGHHKMQKQL